MAFDSQTRNRLARFVTDARELIAEEFTQKFQSLYGLSPSGEITALANLKHLDEEQHSTAERLRARLRHLEPEGRDPDRVKPDTIEHLAREQAFTVLNRLAAIRMAEKRGIIVESVGRGYESKGFKVYLQVAGTALGDTYHRYRRYLLCLFEELAVDLGALFDSRSPAGLLFLREPALLQLLRLLNAPDLEALWAEDETIGWIYQYYNDPAERKKMREQSSAPRNSRELAVRNQFFTPRYVVEFLTDNTLGRIWYEMAKGQTRLKEQCRYLVRRPNEIFLGQDEQVPNDESRPENLSREEILKQAVYIPHRPLKDPRAIRLLDPACGSMHFGLYAFDLFETIYEEAWNLLPGLREEFERAVVPESIHIGDEGALRCDATGEALSVETAVLAVWPYDVLQRDRPGRLFLYSRRSADERRDRLSLIRPLNRINWPALLAEKWVQPQVLSGFLEIHREAFEFQPLDPVDAHGRFQREIPQLIIEHNLHGIDIDPRCAQIAGLSLWLRAQRTWQQQRLQPAERPQIRRSNIVCAEPLPGEEAFLNEFIKGQLSGTAEKNLLGQLVRRVFDAMRLAGEAGSLLKIEEEIADAAAEAKQKWLAGPKLEQGRLFADETAPPAQKELGLDVSGITDEAFWEQAEERIYAALQAYAEQADDGGYQRRLFADDAARGFALIDVCQKRYDIVVMNPPFGEASLKSRDYLYANYGHATQDIFSAFVDRGLSIAQEGGAVGAITSRLAFYLELLEEWRTKLFGKSASLSAMADLGYGVLDGALVEAAAYVIETSCASAKPATFIGLLAQKDKRVGLLRACRDLSNGQPTDDCFTVDPASFITVPACRAAYWVSQSSRDMFRTTRNVQTVYGFPFVGFQTGDDEFFLRLAWEVDPSEIGKTRARWVSFAKGGEYAQFFGDYHLLVNWSARALARRQSNYEAYFKHGVTYTERTTSNLSARILPRNCVFSPNGVTITPSLGRLLECAALLNSRISNLLIEICVGGGDAVYGGSAARHYGPRIIARVPVPTLTDNDAKEIASLVLGIWTSLRDRDARNEPGRYFVSPFFSETCSQLCMSAIAEQRQQQWEETVVEIVTSHFQIDRILARGFQLDDTVKAEMRAEFGAHPAEMPNSEISDVEHFIASFSVPIDQLVDRTVQTKGASRSLTKKGYVADRQLELLSQLFGVHPTIIVRTRRELKLQNSSLLASFSTDIFSYAVGCVFGRWDIRYATGERSAPDLPDPFAPLPVCPPGQLQNEKGMPLTKDDVRRLQAADQWHYPFEVPWDGILVDDPGHPLDIETRVQQVLQIIWKDSWEAIEREACGILGVDILRDYFRKPSGFFADHLKRYSKSRRQAPIYWPLSTASGSYTLWVYYHRLTHQTLHTALADFLEPKIKSIELGAQRQKEEGRTERYEDSIDFLNELKELRAEIERIINLPWNADLNDGVLITASLLWKLFRHGKWQKDLKVCWEELEGGKYDWAHLAFSIWPDRVKEKCKTDRSLAIAHGLEELCTVEGPKPKKGKTPKKNATEEEGEKLLETEVDLDIAPKPAKAPKASAVKDFEPRPISIDQTDRTEVLCTIRQLFSDSKARDRDTAMHDVAAALGYQRVGPRIREVLLTDLLTAVRRGILQNQNGQLSLLARDLRDYQRDFLKENFLSAIGRGWIDRANAIQAFARWLGFSRTGSAIEETGYSLINGLLRDRRLEADKSQIRRAAG
jgi:hypothetical protein